MPLTREFKDLVVERAKRDEVFRRGLLEEAINALFGDDIAVSKLLLRDYINATIGFIELSKSISIPDKSLMRMLSQEGNPQANNLIKIISFLVRMEDIEVKTEKRAQTA